VCRKGLIASDRAFFLKVLDVVEAAVSETTFRQIALKMQKTREIPLTGDPVKAVEVLANGYTLNDTERAGVLRHLIVEGDLTAYGRCGDGGVREAPGGLADGLVCRGPCGQMDGLSPGAASRLAG